MKGKDQLTMDVNGGGSTVSFSILFSSSLLEAEDSISLSTVVLNSRDCQGQLLKKQSCVWRGKKYHHGLQPD